MKQNQKVKAVIFDMDGVLVDTERINLKYWKRLYKEYGYNMEDDVYINLMGRTRPEIVKGMKEVFGDDVPVEEIMKRKSELLVNYIYENPLPMKKGLLEILDFLQKNDIKRAVATSTYRERAQFRLEKGGIYDSFNAVMCGDEVVNSKPDPEIFLKAAKKMGVEPEECIVVEDSPTGVKAAYNGGFITVMVPDLKKPSKDEFDRCDFIVDSLLDIEKVIKEINGL